MSNGGGSRKRLGGGWTILSGLLSTVLLMGKFTHECAVFACFARAIFQSLCVTHES